MLGRSSTTVSGRNATPSLSISTCIAAHTFCSSSAPPASSELPALCAAIPATPSADARAIHRRRTGCLGAGRQRRTGGIHLLGGGVLGIVDATPAVLTPHLDGGADVPVPFEVLGLLSPAEHLLLRSRSS